MKFQLLPSSFEDGLPSARQHLTSFIVDDRVAIDAGSLGFAVSERQRENVRDVLLTHAHLDHIAGLPLFIDDLFSVLTEPIRIHATDLVINVLERDIFNWSVYPRFSELSNANGAVIEYHPIAPAAETQIAHLSIRPIDVNHQVPSTGFIVSDGNSLIAISGDTAEMDGFWEASNSAGKLNALLVECAFPNELEDLALSSCHMTPDRLARELSKFDGGDCPIYVINMKPMYRDRTIEQLNALAIERLRILDVGKIYDF
ncbi:MAG TPA: 3',5'-cyclic-nucleotide phosphodiesterase [Pyrinomonadaceae bacterium]|nr:3',5'-cyclic-nucleotide phosphodiesterase [Pyrinomonadaceae bacterium]